MDLSSSRFVLSLKKLSQRKAKGTKYGCHDEPDFPRGYRRSEAGRPERGDDDEVKVPSLPLGDQRVASGKAALNVQFKKHFTEFSFLPSSRLPSLLQALNRRYSKLRRKTREAEARKRTRRALAIEPIAQSVHRTVKRVRYHRGR